MKTWLFNPFKFIAGNKALGIGIIAMFITALVCLFNIIHLNGIIDVHIGRQTAAWLYFTEPVIDWLSLVLPLYIFGRILSHSSIRLVDVAGTSALARYPMFFTVVFSVFVPISGDDPKKILDTIQSNTTLAVQLFVITIFIIPCVVWTVALMYNAYSISTNLKGPKAVLSFIASFVMAEIVSKTVIYELVHL